MGHFARQFGQFYEAVSSDIYKLCAAMNFNPSWQQAELFDAVMRGDLSIAVKSGQGPGKTTAAVIVAIWRCLQAVGALTILTAPTMRQCRDAFLAEARRLMDKADPVLQKIVTVTQTKIMICDQTDWGVKTITSTKPENAQGIHEENLTIIYDEASGIGDGIIEQFKGTASNPNCLQLMIGNPNTRDCYFFRCFNSLRNHWTTITWNAEETPETAWFSHSRNRQLAEEFGMESDVYRVRVQGLFPHNDPNCVVSSEALEVVSEPGRQLAASKLQRSDGHGGGWARQFGIDFARFGGDESTIFRRSGNAIMQWARFAKTEPTDVVDVAFRMQRDAQWIDNDCTYICDATGIGQGILGKLHQAGKNVFEFHNGGRASESRIYDNRITEAWFHFAKLVNSKQCYIPNDNTLIQQLCTRRYFTNKKGLLLLEPKDDYMKRGHDSPDRADGIVMCFYDELNTQSQSVYGQRRRDVGTKITEQN